MLVCELYGAKKRILLWNGSRSNAHLADLRSDVSQQGGRCHDAATGKSLYVSVTAEAKKGNLFNVRRQCNAIEQAWYVLAPSFKFLGIASLAYRPCTSVHGRLDMDKVLPLRAERHNVQLAFIAALVSPPNLDIAAHELAAKLVPLGGQLFAMVHLGTTLNRTALRNSVDFDKLLAAQRRVDLPCSTCEKNVRSNYKGNC